MPGGVKTTFDTNDKEGQEYVAVIAITPENQVIIARQFRAGPEKVMDEIPGGGVEPGEDLQEAAERELLEETGYSVQSMQYLGYQHKDCYRNARHHYFLALSAVPDERGQNLDQNEHVEVALLTIDEFLANAKNGLVSDAAGVLLAYDYLRELQQKG